MFFYELSLPNRWIIQRCLQSGTIYSGRSSRWSLRSVKAVSPGCKQRVQSVNRGTKSLKNAKNWRRNKFTCWFDPVLEYLWLSNYFESAESSFSFFFFFFSFFFHLLSSNENASRSVVSRALSLLSLLSPRLHNLQRGNEIFQDLRFNLEKFARVNFCLGLRKSSYCYPWTIARNFL